MRPLLAPGLLCAALVLSSCGDGSEQAQPPPAAPSSPASSPSPSTSPPAPSPSARALMRFQLEGFSASFPSEPERSQQPVQTPVGQLDVVAYQSLGDTDGYSVSYFQIPQGGGADLAGAIAGAARQVEGTATDEVETTYQGFPARDARITNAFGEGTIFTRVIAANSRLYQLQYLVDGVDVTAPAPEYPEFLASLTFS